MFSTEQSALAAGSAGRGDLAADEVAALLHSLDRRLHGCVAAVARAQGWTPAMALLVREVAVRPGSTVSDLGRSAGLSKSRTSVLVDRLVADGLAIKRPDGADQRLARVYPTEATDGWRARFADTYRAAAAEVLGDIEPGLQGHLLEALRALQKAAVRRGWQAV
jgi:DNA-binding MarR family transcriptional regulator